MNLATTATLLLATIGLNLAACSANEGQGPSEGAEQRRILATLDVGEARVEFEDLGGGWVAVTGTAPRDSRLFSDRALSEKSVIQQYEYFSGMPAPQELVDAMARSAAEAKAVPESDEVVEDTKPNDEVLRSGEEEVGTSTQALPAEEFSERFCHFDYCLLNMTTDHTIERRAHSLSAHTDAAIGSVDVRVRLNRALGGWSNERRWTVLEGQILWSDINWNGSAKRPLQTSVLRVDSGDLYHLSARIFW